jgi:hypothetical protein
VAVAVLRALLSVVGRRLQPREHFSAERLHVDDRGLEPKVAEPIIQLFNFFKK